MRVLSLRREVLEEANIPEAFWPLGADTYPGTPESLESINKYVKESKFAAEHSLGLLIRGPTESFKTFLITYVLKCLSHQGWEVYYCKFRDSCDRYFDNEIDFSTLYSCSNFLAIDDLSLPPNRGEATVLMQILKMRKDEGKPVLLSTTFSDEKLAHYFGVSAFDYIRKSLTAIETKPAPFVSEPRYEELKKRFS